MGKYEIPISDQLPELLTESEKRDVEMLEEQFIYQREMELEGYYL